MRGSCRARDREGERGRERESRHFRSRPRQLFALKLIAIFQVRKHTCHAASIRGADQPAEWPTDSRAALSSPGGLQGWEQEGCDDLENLLSLGRHPSLSVRVADCDQALL